MLRAGIDWNLAHLSPRAKVASTARRSGRFVEDFCNWQENPHYRRFIFESALPAAAGRLMRSSTARLYHDHMLTKEPGTRAADTLASGPAVLQYRRHARTSASGFRSIR